MSWRTRRKNKSWDRILCRKLNVFPTIKQILTNTYIQPRSLASIGPDISLMKTENLQLLSLSEPSLKMEGVKNKIIISIITPYLLKVILTFAL